MEQSHFKCRNTNFKVTEIAEIRGNNVESTNIRIGIIVKNSISKYGNPILNYGKHFSKGVLKETSKNKNVLEFNVEKEGWISFLFISYVNRLKLNKIV